MKLKLMILGALFASFSFAQTTQPMPSITVNGTANVKVVPDQVEISFGIETRGQKAADVQKQNAQLVDSVLKYIASQGIPASDYKTERVYLNDQFVYNKKKSDFVAQQNVTLLIKKIDQYDKIVAGLLERGVNAIDNVQLKSSQVEAKRSEARKLAVENARIKAEELATAAGVKLGKPFTITDNTNEFMPPQYMKAAFDTTYAEASELTTLAPGEMTVTANVYIMYLIL